MIAANIGQSIAGWAYGIIAVCMIGYWKVSPEYRTMTLIKHLVILWVPFIILYGIAGGIGALAG